MRDINGATLTLDFSDSIFGGKARINLICKP